MNIYHAQNEDMAHTSVRSVCHSSIPRAEECLLSATFLIKIPLFISINEEEKHLIWPSQCKYAFSDVYPRGSAAIDMF